MAKTTYRFLSLGTDVPTGCPIPATRRIVLRIVIGASNRMAEADLTEKELSLLLMQTAQVVELLRSDRERLKS